MITLAKCHSLKSRGRAGPVYTPGVNIASLLRRVRCIEIVDDDRVSLLVDQKTLPTPVR